MSARKLMALFIIVLNPLFSGCGEESPNPWTDDMYVGDAETGTLTCNDVDCGDNAVCELIDNTPSCSVACRPADDFCPGDMRCLGGACRDVCGDEGDCPSGMACVEEWCVPTNN